MTSSPTHSTLFHFFFALQYAERLNCLVCGNLISTNNLNIHYSMQHPESAYTKKELIAAFQRALGPLPVMTKSKYNGKTCKTCKHDMKKGHTCSMFYVLKNDRLLYVFFTERCHVCKMYFCNQSTLERHVIRKRC